MHCKLIFRAFVLVLIIISTKSNDQKVKSEPSITPKPFLDASDDANKLRSAMKGFGTEESKIVYILTLRTKEQRKQIYDKYKLIFSRDLVEDLMSEMSGNLLKVLVYLLTDPLGYMAAELQAAMEGWGTDEDTITEILCSHTGEENQKISDIFNQKYKRTLSAALSSEISGNYLALMQKLITVQRREVGNTRQISAILLPKIEKKSWFSKFNVGNSKRFIEILPKISFNQIRLVLGDYHEVGSQTLRDTIYQETSGNFRKALTSIVDMAENTPLFFAKRLYQAMERFGTNDEALIRIIVTRAEIDLKSIKEEFEKNYKKTLREMVESETTGVYRKALITLIEGKPLPS